MPKKRPITDQDFTTVLGLEKGLNNSVADSINHLSELLEALKRYQSIIKTATESNLNYAKIVNKYASHDRNSSTYSLPAVMATTIASYDINQIKRDNAALAEYKDAKEQSALQKDAHFKDIVQYFSALKSDLNRVGVYNQKLFFYIDSLNDRV